MGSTTHRYRPTLKEVDIAFNHGSIDEAKRLLMDSGAHPLSGAYRYREALIALAEDDVEEAQHCISQVECTPAEKARYLRHLLRLHLRKHRPEQARAALEQLERSRVSDEGWLISMHGLVTYRMAQRTLRRDEQTELFEEASRRFEAAEKYWIEHDCANRAWQLNNRWWWFKTEWRLLKRFHLSSSEYLRRLDNLRWDVIDNDPSFRRRAVARMPGLTFWLAEKA